MKNLIKYTINTILIISSITLLGMMVLVFLDVMLRYVFDCPIPGAYELTEYMMAIFIPLSIVFCQNESGHIGVDLLVEKFSLEIQAALSVIVNLLCLVFLVLITFQSVLKIKEEVGSGLTSAVLHVPSYPFVIPTCIGFFLFSVFMVCLIFSQTKEIFKR